MLYRVKVTAVAGGGERLALGEMVVTARDFTGVQVRALDGLRNGRLDTASCAPRYEMMQLPRYLVAENWEHLFSNARQLVRFVFDLVLCQMAQMQLHTQVGWISASTFQIKDLADSLKHGNEDVLDRPQDYGLIETDDLPDWAR